MSRTSIHILNQMRALLHKDGWTQRNLHDGSGHCLLGAYARVTGQGDVLSEAELDLDLFPDSLYWQARRELILRDEVGDATDDTVAAIANFNDNPDTTFEDIDLIIKRAIAEEERQDRGNRSSADVDGGDEQVWPGEIDTAGLS
jgi:hypothetical protein